jgi:hypothetical protein
LGKQLDMQTIMKQQGTKPCGVQSGGSRTLAVVGMIAALVIASASNAETNRQGSDPLSQAEMDLVRNAALIAGPAAAAKKSSGVQSQSSETTYDLSSLAAEPVLLLIERRSTEKDDPQSRRLADVYYYDYSDDTLIHSIVDVDAGIVQSRSILRNVQLPLVDPEIQRAMEIVMADPVSRRGLQDAYQRATGALLDSMNQIDFKAFVFHASTLSAELVLDSAMCGAHRCAQLITYTHDNISLDYSPIVDLSDGRVTQVIGL